MWPSLTRTPFRYEGSDIGLRFRISSSGVTRVVSSRVEFTPSSREVLQMRERVSSTTMWFIWKDSCKTVIIGYICN